MSLKDIAIAANTSVSTVSRVLNHKTNATHDPALYERIWELAAAQGYTPNDTARQLRMPTVEKTAYTVDIFLTRFEFLDSDPFFKELYDCLREELMLKGYHMGELLSSEDILYLSSIAGNNEHMPYRSHRSTLATTIDGSTAMVQKENTGLIILGKCPANIIPALKKRYGQIVGIDRNPSEFLYDEIFCNGTTAATTAMEYLLSQGHNRIAYIGDCSYEARYVGYCQVLISHHLPLDHNLIIPTDQTYDEGVSAAAKLLAMPAALRPTATFCANDITAHGVIKYLKRHGRSGYMPAIIAIDNIKASESTTPMLTTIDIPKQQMCHLAIELLSDRLSNGHTDNVRLELPFKLIVRESC